MLNRRTIRTGELTLARLRITLHHTASSLTASANMKTSHNQPHSTRDKKREQGGRGENNAHQHHNNSHTKNGAQQRDISTNTVLY